MSTSRPSWGNFIGCQYDRVLTLSWPHWFTRHWMVCLHHTWQMTASLSLRLADDDFDRPMSLHVRFQELAKSGRLIFHRCWTWPWNILPLHLHDSERSLLECCWLLKTHLFSWGINAQRLLFLQRVTNVLAYLLTGCAHCRPQIFNSKL